MKKSLFLTMIAAAFLGGQTLAADPIMTAVTDSAGQPISPIDGKYYGKYSTTESVSGVQVTVSHPETGGENLSGADVYGGYTEASGGGATGNKVVMTGGQVKSVYGAYSSSGIASNNTVILNGGILSSNVYGGRSLSGTADGNKVYVVNGSVTGAVQGGYSNSGTTINSEVHLVGKGAAVTVDSVEYANNGSGLTLTGTVSAGGGGSSRSGNSFDIYGSAITARGIQNMQILNFHLVNGMTEDSSPMITLTRASLMLGGVTGTIYGDAVTDWTAYEGKSITLVQAEQAITLDDGEQAFWVDGKEVNITDADAQVLATAKLSLSEDQKTLSLTNIKATPVVPEPATGTLSLLALCALAARRRKH